jgi:hypothetical protein
MAPANREGWIIASIHRHREWRSLRRKAGSNDPPLSLTYI